MSTILLVTERALGEQEITNLAVVSEGVDEVQVRVLIPTGLQRRLWVEFLDQLALLDFKEAFEVLSGSESREGAVDSEAQQHLQDSLRLLEEAGYPATGRIAAEAPLEAMKQEVADGARQVLIITDPHPVEDTFNIHWSHEAAQTLGVPVLHLYWGTEHIDD